MFHEIDGLRIGTFEIIHETFLLLPAINRKGEGKKGIAIIRICALAAHTTFLSLLAIVTVGKGG